MAELPYMRVYVADYEADENVKRMDLAAEGLFWKCLRHAWLNGSIPSDLDELAFMIRATSREVKKLWPRVAPCFRPNSNGRLVNPRQEREREKARKISAGRSKAAQARWHQEGNANAVQMQCKSSTSSYDTRYVSNSVSKSSSPRFEDQVMQDLYDFFVEQYSQVSTVPDDLWQSFPAYVTGSAELLKDHLPGWMEWYKQSGRFAPDARKFLKDGAWKRKAPTRIGRTSTDALTERMKKL